MLSVPARVIGWDGIAVGWGMAVGLGPAPKVGCAIAVEAAPSDVAAGVVAGVSVAAVPQAIINRPNKDVKTRGHRRRRQRQILGFIKASPSYLKISGSDQSSIRGHRHDAIFTSSA